MQKDELYGGIIFIVAVVLIALYNLWLFNFLPTLDPIYGLYIPVWLLGMFVLGAAGWIGRTMASTPPPKPIEELTPMASTVTTTAAAKTDDTTSGSNKTQALHGNLPFIFLASHSLQVYSPHYAYGFDNLVPSEKYSVRQSLVLAWFKT